jgi:hypothetical protein
MALIQFAFKETSYIKSNRDEVYQEILKKIPDEKGKIETKSGKKINKNFAIAAVTKGGEVSAKVKKHTVIVDGEEKEIFKKDLEEYKGIHERDANRVRFLDRHRQIVYRIAMGQSKAEICRELNISRGNLHIIVSSDIFKAELQKMQAKIEDNITDVTRIAKHHSPQALNKVLHVMNGEKTKARDVIAAADRIFKLAGFIDSGKRIVEGKVEHIHSVKDHHKNVDEAWKIRQKKIEAAKNGLLGSEGQTTLSLIDDKYKAESGFGKNIKDVIIDAAFNDVTEEGETNTEENLNKENEESLLIVEPDEDLIREIETAESDMILDSYIPAENSDNLFELQNEENNQEESRRTNQNHNSELAEMFGLDA